MFRRVPALIMTLPLAGMMLAILVGAPLFHGEDYPDPFADYEALAPGQPVSALDRYPCSFLYVQPVPYDDTVYCQIRPAGGPFRLISVTTDGITIRSVTFIVDGLQVGDLVQRWGRPNALNKEKPSFRLTWDSGVVATGHTHFWFNYQAGVGRVTLLPARTSSPAQVVSGQEETTRIAALPEGVAVRDTQEGR